MAYTVKFTKPAIASLPPAPSEKRAMYAHPDKKGLYVRVSPTGRKTFLLYRKPKGQPRPVKVTLGTFPDMPIEKAIKLFEIENAKLAEGLNPNKLRKEAKASEITLSEVFADYLAARKNLKPNTVKDYTAIMNEMFSDWLPKPLKDITRDMVATRHTKHGKRSHARANNGMRVLRALFNFAAGEYENAGGGPMFPDNPVARLSHTRAWYRVDRRRTVIKPHELKPWFDAVLGMQNTLSNDRLETYRDYFITAILTGLRLNEAARLRVEDVDPHAKTLTVYDTKNSEPHSLPLPPYLYELLANRASQSTNGYVFEVSTSRTGYVQSLNKHIERIRNDSGVNFTMHDLRRTFLTTAESLDISAYAVKRLANHKMRDDVTAGYIVTDVERLRKPMEQITDYILKAANIKSGATVVPIGSASA